MTSELLRLLEVMDRLRSPGGCPWDAEQTHQSLIKYLLEESYEFVDAVDADDRTAMREELGDLLYQVEFHATIAEQEGRFSLADVAAGYALGVAMGLVAGALGFLLRTLRPDDRAIQQEIDRLQRSPPRR